MNEHMDKAVDNWARSKEVLHVGVMPPQAVNLNVEGRQVAGPLQGFGQLWQRTYRVRLEGVAVSPAEVVATWKAHFPAFQPPQNRFYPSVSGVEPGAVVLINATVQGMPVHTGVLVLYADETSFTLITLEGHPESGLITFSAWEEDGCCVVQVQSMYRTSDPFYELGFVMLGGSRAQKAIWTHVLANLAAHFGVSTSRVAVAQRCVDRQLQWDYLGNLWHNAMLRSVAFTLIEPFRKARFARSWLPPHISA